MDQWIIEIGLLLDLVGAGVLAYAAWIRVETTRNVRHLGRESDDLLRHRRWILVIGALLMAAGFGLQGYGNWPL